MSSPPLCRSSEHARHLGFLEQCQILMSGPNDARPGDRFRRHLGKVGQKFDGSESRAEVSATLIGLFLVGVFFYIETGLRRADRARATFEPYLRAGTRITLIVFAIPLGLSLTLVALEPAWGRLLFIVLSLLLIAANVDSVVRVRGVRRVTGSTALLVNEVVTTALTAVLIFLSWVLGGLRPTREDLTWAIILAFAAGFLSIGAVVISAFDVARLESGTAERRRGQASTEGPRSLGPSVGEGSA